MLDLRKGTELADRYTLVRRLGGDTRTHTWLANDRLTKASVALKIGSNDADLRDDLRKEWQRGIRLMHAHIVRVFEFHDDSDATVFSQQYVDGPGITAITGQDIAQILRPIGLLLDALAYMHGKGIVHRDVKASNILLDRNGAPYLCDFGASVAVGQEGNGGSLAAQSPQSLDGAPASAADDIFAVGTMIYELVSGNSPWSGDDIGHAIRNSVAPTLRAPNGDALPDVVSELLGRMLDKAAEGRPTAEQAAATLRRAGYTAGAATLSSSTPAAISRPIDEVIESQSRVQPVKPGHAAAKAAAAQAMPSQSTGLNPRFVGGGLLALLALLLGVIFVLPNSVSKSPIAPTVPVTTDALTPTADPLDTATTPATERIDVYVDPEVRRRVKGNLDEPVVKLAGDDDITFSENRADYSGLDKEGRARFEVEATLGELLAGLEVLETRGVHLWAPVQHREARDLYEKGDAAYLKKDFAYAEELYLGALTVIEPLYERIEPTFDESYAGAIAAFSAGDRTEALRLYELAVAITPNHPGAQAGYERAKNLESVLRLVEQGIEYEEDLELEAAQRSYEQAVALDPLWQDAHDGIARVAKIRTKNEFDLRMSDGFAAIAAGDLLSARAAFRFAQQLIPESTEPADGLLQVDQGLRMRDIGTLEQEVQSLETDEHWDAVVSTYEEILKVDQSLAFARDGLAEARKMSALHQQLDDYIAEPDKLSAPRTMQAATKLVVDITTRTEVGPRLAAQRDELSRLLRRAATPLSVPLVSDNATEVFVYKVGKIGRFTRREIDLRPGTYVVVGSRPGFRDVRLEFRVAPEVSMEPVVVQCEERI